jgi:hypothetical protein
MVHTASLQMLHLAGQETRQCATNLLILSLVNIVVKMMSPLRVNVRMVMKPHPTRTAVSELTAYQRLSTALNIKLVMRMVIERMAGLARYTKTPMVMTLITRSEILIGANRAALL